MPSVHMVTTRGFVNNLQLKCAPDDPTRYFFVKCTVICIKSSVCYKITWLLLSDLYLLALACNKSVI